MRLYAITCFFLSQNLSFPAQDAINLDAEERSPRI